MNHDPADPDYGAQNISEMARRQERLDALYIYDGRDDSAHRHHGVYSGLAHLYPDPQRIVDAMKEACDVFEHS